VGPGRHASNAQAGGRKKFRPPDVEKHFPSIFARAPGQNVHWASYAKI
jgi:hypothetical protein